MVRERERKETRSSIDEIMILVIGSRSLSSILFRIIFEILFTKIIFINCKIERYARIYIIRMLILFATYLSGICVHSFNLFTSNGTVFTSLERSKKLNFAPNVIQSDF